MKIQAFAGMRRAVNKISARRAKVLFVKKKNKINKVKFITDFMKTIVKLWTITYALLQMPSAEMLGTAVATA
jgi:hypothetical protein